MDKARLIEYLKAMDRALKEEAVLCVYGSAAFILLDEAGRTSLDIDVAAPYSNADYGAIERAAREAGLAVNPDEGERGDHIEWISALRLCLAKPAAESEIELWRGRRLRLKTVSAADLVASKLIRYDDIDQADVQFLCGAMKIPLGDIREAVERLPQAFRDDPIVRDNLDALERDLAAWTARG